MPISLVSAVRELLLKVKFDPKRNFVNNQFNIDEDLLSEMKSFTVQYSKKKKFEKQIIQNEILNNGLEEIIKPVLLKLASIGYDYTKHPKLIADCLKYTIGFIINNYPMHVCWHPFRVGLDTPSEKVKKIDDLINLTSTDYFSPHTEIRYTIENSLVSWNLSEWSITPLGNLCLSLSSATATVFLLKLEMYLNNPNATDAFDSNPYHMSRKFLQSLYETKSIYVDLGDTRYSLYEDDPNMNFLGRIQDFGLINTEDLTESRRLEEDDSAIPMFHIGDDFFETKLTDFGREVISQALNSENKFLDELIHYLIKIELSGGKYLEFGDKGDFHELKELIATHKSILAKEYKALTEIVDKVNDGIFNIHLLRSLYPSIESLLKKILVKEKIVSSSGIDITLGPIIQKFKADLKNKVILSRETLDYLISMERNNVLHGSVTPTDQLLKQYMNLTLNFLVMILSDYSKYLNS